MTEQFRSQNAGKLEPALRENPFQGELIDLLTDDRPKFDPRDFRFDIVYVSWLLNWVVIGQASFPVRNDRFHGERVLEALGFVLIVGPLASVMLLVLTVPVAALVAWAICAAANAMGFRRKVQRRISIDGSARLFTFTRCLLFAGAAILAIVLATLNMLGYGLSAWIKIGSFLEALLGILYVIAFIIGWFYLWFYIAPDRTAETTADQDAQADAD
jgi:hypothetical protein